MRLIDVDLYCATICKCNKRECDKEKCPIHNAPTAYDIDKVVEELAKLIIMVEQAGCIGRCESSECVKCGIFKAIEIVKQGGVGKDVE